MDERAPNRPEAEQPSPAAPSGEPDLGDRVGPYRLVKLLGSGTGGRVFEVVHERLERRAALKLLNPAQAARPSARARFLAEALAVGRISHPHIVEVTDVVEDAGEAALVMELLDGQSLGAALAREAPLPPERFLPILAQVCEALAAAHAAGFVHRDLKPENVFLCAGADGTDFVKLLDFGVATSFGPTSSSTLPRGALVGTPAYASPEQAEGGAIDHKADIYSVGVMLYELACGRLPYEGWTTGQFLIQHLSAPVPRLPPDMRATPLGQALDVVVQRCMAKQPAARFGSAAELAATFAALAVGDFTTARSTVTLAPLSPLGRRARIRALAALAVVAGLALAWFVVGQGREASEPAATAAATRGAAPPARPAPPAFATVTFTSEPPGAEVRAASGELYGVTPFTRAFSRSEEEHALEFTRAGYKTVHLLVRASAPRAVSVTLSRATRPRARHAPRFGSEKTIDPFRR